MKQQPSNRALVVEDDRSWQQILSELLQDSGLIVDVAGSYETAEAMMRTVPHRLAIVDLSLGGPNHHNRDGLKVLEDLRRMDPACRSVLLTGFATVEIAVSAMKEYGALTCLRKEVFRRSELHQLVSEVMVAAPGSVQPSSFQEPQQVNVQHFPVQAEQDESGAPAAILVVEDDAGWSSIMVELLYDAGYRPHHCRSYGEALGLLSRQRFGLAVVDLSLASSTEPRANADGFRLLATCADSSVPAIVVSGIASTDDAEKVYSEYGAYAFQEKQSFNRQTFVKTVSDALRATTPPDALGDLTQREREVMQLLIAGKANKQIAEELVISPNTVKRHLKSIFSKMKVGTRAAAVAKVMEDYRQ